MRKFNLADLLYPDGTLNDGKLLKMAWFSHNVASNVALVTAISDVFFRVHAMVVGGASATRFGLWSNGSTTVLGNFILNSNIPTLVLPFNPFGYCQFSQGIAIHTYEESAAIVNGIIIYSEI